MVLPTKLWQPHSLKYFDKLLIATVYIFSTTSDFFGFEAAFTFQFVLLICFGVLTLSAKVMPYFCPWNPFCQLVEMDWDSVQDMVGLFDTVAISPADLLR